MKRLTALKRDKECWFLLIASFIFFLLRFPSLFEPYWYGDEGIYQTIGMGINKGRMLYTQIWDNKPPFLYLVYAFFSADQFLVRLASLLVGIASVIIFFFAAKKLFAQKTKPVFLATLLFAVLFGLPLLEGNIANAENFMLLPILLAVFFVLSYQENKKSANLYFAGVFLSLAFLFKVVAAFDFAAFAVFLFFQLFNNKSISIKNTLYAIKKLLPLSIAFAGPILLITIYFLIKGAFLEFYQATFTQMVSYVAYGNTFLFAQGFLLIKLILLLTFLAILFRLRKNIYTSILFILIWLSFSVFNSFFTQRPYTHYLLVLLPSFTLLAGSVSAAQKKYLKNAGILFIALFILLLSRNFNLYLKNAAYYKNFIQFLTHQKSISSYYAFFDRKTPRDYEIAQFIKMHAKPKDTLYVWGNNAQLYKMTQKLPPGRFTVAYHATATKKNWEETKKAVKNTQPTYLVVTSSNNPFPYSLKDYIPRLFIGESTIYERIR